MSSHPSGTVTFVFTDIEGSTGAWDAHHRAMDAALALHDGIVADVVGHHGGYIFSTGGDGVAIAFQSARSSPRQTGPVTPRSSRRSRGRNATFEALRSATLLVV